MSIQPGFFSGQKAYSGFFDICHLGPSEECKGGIRTVMEDISTAVELEGYAQVIVPTAAQRHRIRVFLRGWSRCCRLMDGNHVGVLHVHMSENASCYRAGLLLSSAKKRGVPVVLHSHGSTIVSFLEGLPKLLCAKLIEAFAQADCLIALTPQWAAWWGSLLPDMDVQVIPNGVRLPSCSASSEVCARDEEEGVDLLFLGQLGWRKGTYDLLKAFSIAISRERGYRLHLHLAGDGQVEECAAYAESLGLEGRVTFHGWVEGPNKEALLRECRALVLPSHFESFGIAILEAFSYGKAVVCSDGGHMDEIVKDGVNGIVFPAGDVEALAHCLESCSEKASMLQAMGAAGREMVIKQYSSSVVAERWKALYGAYLG